MPSTNTDKKKKTLIGVLASNDDFNVNSRLVMIFNQLYDLQSSGENYSKHIPFPFHFVFTGGTHDRLFYGDETLKLNALNEDVANWLISDCGVTRLPTTFEGGVIVLSYLISQRECNIIWPFFAPHANHWQRNENLALTRLCDQWHVKRLMNAGSVMTWYRHESEHDKYRNLRACPPILKLEVQPGEKKRLEIINPVRSIQKYRGGDEPKKLGSLQIIVEKCGSMGNLA
ncbi:MAG: hypothetical protein JZU65_00025 [Chlorobium sp.]|jgi:hypothetical protein|nr:hypothetical protein [Chlorobium sp.]